MLQRFKRPGYIIIALIIVTIYFYGQYKKMEIKKHKEAILNTYKSYGKDILGSIKEGDFSKLQSSFNIGDKKNITLEDIATFVSTLHLDKIGDVRWKKIESKDNNISMGGDLVVNRDITYPIDMMIVKRGKKLILNKMVIDGKTLQTKEIDFPLDSWFDSNHTDGDTILVKECNSLQREINSSYIYKNDTNSSK